MIVLPARSNDPVAAIAQPLNSCRRDSFDHRWSWVNSVLEQRFCELVLGAGSAGETIADLDDLLLPDRSTGGITTSPGELI